MESVRVISGAELGAIRFATSKQTRTWLVEFKLRDGAGGAAFGRARDPPSCVVSSMEGATQSVFLARAARGEWRAVLSLPEGLTKYELHRAGSVAASGSVDVQAPDAPLENSALCSTLKSRAPSGAEQQRLRVDRDPDERALEGTWPVKFVYAEACFGIREVWVEPVEGQPVRCSREENADGQVVYSGVLNIPEGLCRFRFRVVLSEACPAHSAPFTRLGWDAGASHSGGLTTWELSVQVNNLDKTGALPGSSILHHEKEHIPEEGRTETELMSAAQVPGSSSIVRNAVSLLDSSSDAAAKHQSRLGDRSTVRGFEDDRENFKMRTGVAACDDTFDRASGKSQASHGDAVGRGESKVIQSPPLSDESISDAGSRSRARPRVMLLSGIALYAAVALTSILGKRLASASDDGEEWDDFYTWGHVGDDGMKRTPTDASNSAGEWRKDGKYFEHAKSQSW